MNDLDTQLRAMVSTMTQCSNNSCTTCPQFVEQLKLVFQAYGWVKNNERSE